MNKEEVKKIVENKKEIELKYLMGTKAFHLCGDLSSEFADLFTATAETDKYWIGGWVEGIGFFNVIFPKETSRCLTQKEIDKYNKGSFQINNQIPFKLNINKA